MLLLSTARSFGNSGVCGSCRHTLTSHGNLLNIRPEELDRRFLLVYHIERVSCLVRRGLEDAELVLGLLFNPVLAAGAPSSICSSKGGYLPESQAA